MVGALTLLLAGSALASLAGPIPRASSDRAWEAPAPTRPALGEPALPFLLPPPIGPTDWPTYLHDGQRTGRNANDTGISLANASKLALAWSVTVNGSVLGSLIVVNGTVITGSRSGYLLAYDALHGRPLGPGSNPPWLLPNLGHTYYSTCGGAGANASKKTGLIATPTYANGRVYEPAGTTQFVTLGPDGSVLSRLDVGNASRSPWYYEYNWASPLIYNGSAYVGTGALCEFNDGDPISSHWKYIQGQLLQFDLSTGTLQHRFNVTKDSSSGDVGGSIWSTPSVDPATNTVWVSTGNENASTQTPANGEYPRAIVALNATTLKVVSSCQVGGVGADNDFGAGPTLFHGAHGARYVGAINKDGTFYAYNATSPTGGSCNGATAPSLRLVWSDAFCTYGGSGPLSPAAFDGHDLYVASNGCTNASGHVAAIDPDTGRVLWDHVLYSPPAIVLGGISTANGLLFITANNDSTGNANGFGELQVLNASSGALLYQRIFNTSLASAPVVAGGTIYLGLGNFSNSGSGYVDALRVPASTLALNPVAVSPGAGAVPLNETFYAWARGGSPPYAYHWTFGDNATHTSNLTGNTSHTYTTVGEFTARLVATDAAAASVSFSVVVTVEATKLVVSAVSFSPPSIDVGQSTVASVRVTGGGGDYNFSWFGLPGPCLSMNSSSLSCRPSTAGSYGVFVCVRDDAYVSACDSGSGPGLVVWGPPKVDQVVASRPNLDVDEQTILSIVTSSFGSGFASVLWSNLPTGCQSSMSTNLACRPTGVGTFQVSGTITDTNGAGSSGSAQVIVDPTPTIDSLTASPPGVDLGQTTFLSTQVSGGSGVYTYGWSGLPNGCAPANMSILRCKASAAGNFTVVLAITDSTGASAAAAASLQLEVGQPLSSNVAASRGSIEVGGSITIRITASGGLGPYSYSYAGLPPGCASSNQPLVTCSPSAPGTYAITGIVADSANEAAYGNLSINVTSSGPTILSPGSIILIASGAAIVAGTSAAVVVMVRRRRSRPGVSADPE